MNPAISIITPAYNASKHISGTMRSVLASGFKDWEMIIVDDGSKDNTAEVIQPFLADNRIKLIRQPNKGVSAARNAGIKTAMGKYITFLDADDEYTSDNLGEKYEALTKNNAIDFAYSDMMQCDDKLNDQEVIKGAEADNLFERVLKWQGENIPGLSSNIMLKTELMKRLLFDEHLSNCADRYLKILLTKDSKGVYIPKPLVKYRNTPSSMSKSVGLLEHDETYIISQLKEKNIIPAGKFRNQVIANIYMILSGSWYRNAKKPARAIKFAVKAIATYPPIIFRFLGKTSAVFSNK